MLTAGDCAERVSGGSDRVLPQRRRAVAGAELGHRVALDLADPLAGDAEHPADLVQGAGPAVDQAVAHPDHGLLALVESVQHLVDVVGA